MACRLIRVTLNVSVALICPKDGRRDLGFDPCGRKVPSGYVPQLGRFKRIIYLRIILEDGVTAHSSSSTPPFHETYLEI